MEQKTVIQELIEIMNQDQVSFTEWFQDNYELFLQKEKEQIENVYRDGFIDGCCDAIEYAKENKIDFNGDERIGV